MAVTEAKARVVSRIWQSIASSGVSVNAIPKDQLDTLVNAIADGVLVAIDQEFEEAGLPSQGLAAEAAPLGDEEKLLWEGPALPVADYLLPYHQPAGACAVRDSRPRLRRHRADPHPGPGPLAGPRRAHAGHRRHPHHQRRSIAPDAGTEQRRRSGQGARDPAQGHARRAQEVPVQRAGRDVEAATDKPPRRISGTFAPTFRRPVERIGCLLWNLLRGHRPHHTSRQRSAGQP